MRLTLRTLLAWLDDTLPPAEVRQIGHQVAESPFAKQLVERIHRVTRRRRLTVPPNSGTDAVDPNSVASYLDNELEAELVAEYEKKCLTSDVHLAEAASCHQILSMIRNKAKVPADSRLRMYRLVKGRESVRPREAEGPRVPSVSNTAEPVPPWSQSEVPSRPVWEYIVSGTAVAGLIAVLGWLAWSNLSTGRLADLAALDGSDPDLQAPVEPAEGALPGMPVEPGRDDLAADPDAEDFDPDAVALVLEESELPPGALGVVQGSDGVLLRARPNGNGWTQLEADAAIEDGQRLVSLAPFRNVLDLGSIAAVLIGQTELRVEEPLDEHAARIALTRGRLVVVGGDDRKPIEVAFHDQSVVVTPPVEGPVGLELRGQREMGHTAKPPMLLVSVPDGKAVVQWGEVTEELEGPAVLRMDPVEGLIGPERQVAPDWVTAESPPPEEIEVGEAFANLFQTAGSDPVFALLQGIEDDSADVQELSVLGLGALGDDTLELIMPLLSRQSPTLRQAAIMALLGKLAYDPEAPAMLRPSLDRFAESPRVAASLERLLIGFTAEEVQRDETYAWLVDRLASVNPAVRDLAIATLQDLTGRDNLGYDPNNPEGRALEEWRKLLQTRALRPARSENP